MAKLPSFQFYPGDWMKDPALRSISEGARGLWIDLLCLMHEAPVRGVLAHRDGTPFSVRDISRATGVPPKRIPRYLAEFERVSLCSFAFQNDSVLEPKVIQSRRQMRDESARDKDRLRKADARKAKELADSVRNLSVVCPDDVRLLSSLSSSSSSSSSSDLSLSKERVGAGEEIPAPAYFEPDSADPVSGRCRLKDYPFVFMHQMEMEKARAKFDGAGFDKAAFRDAMSRCNVEMEGKQDNAKLKSGLAFKYLTGHILTDALEQKKKLNNVNGAHSAPPPRRRPARDSVPTAVGAVLAKIIKPTE